MSELHSLHKNANMSKDASEQVVEHDFINQNAKYFHESPHKKKCWRRDKFLIQKNLKFLLCPSWV